MARPEHNHEGSTWPLWHLCRCLCVYTMQIHVFIVNLSLHNLPQPMDSTQSTYSLGKILCLLSKCRNQTAPYLCKKLLPNWNSESYCCSETLPPPSTMHCDLLPCNARVLHFGFHSLKMLGEDNFSLLPLKQIIKRKVTLNSVQLKSRGTWVAQSVEHVASAQVMILGPWD